MINNTVKQTAGVTLAFLMLLCTGWYYNHLSPMPLLDKETLSNTIDTTISQLTVKQFDTTGELVNQLTTPLMSISQKIMFTYCRRHI